MNKKILNIEIADGKMIANKDKLCLSPSITLQIEYNGMILPFEETNEAVTRIYTPKEVQ